MGKFIGIISGKWALGVPEGTEGAVTRENKNGKVVHELLYSELTGKLCDMLFKKTSFGTVAELYIEDNEGERFKASFSMRDQHLMTLAKIIPNVNLDEEVTLLLMTDKDKTAKRGSPCYALLVKQGGEWVKHHWKRDNLPQAEETRDGLNFTKQEDFLLDDMEQRFEATRELVPAGADDDNAPF